MAATFRRPSRQDGLECAQVRGERTGWFDGCCVFLAPAARPAPRLPRLSDHLHAPAQPRPRARRRTSPDSSGSTTTRTSARRPARSSTSVASSTTSCGSIFYTGFVIFLGLFIAVVAMPGPLRVDHQGDRLPARWPSPATALAVIWKFVYAPDSEHRPAQRRPRRRRRRTRSPGSATRTSSTAALIAVGIWGSSGFATVILSAALKGIPTEIIEAARTDGAERDARSSSGSSCRWSACRSRCSR